MSMTTPAGWYPDPSGGPNQRWWDGAQWTDQLSNPYAPVEVLKAPEGTRVYNVWIWLVVFVPYLSLPLLFTTDYSQFLTNVDYTDPTSSSRLQFDMLTSPGVLLGTIVGWVVIAASIVLSWVDWRWLKAAGVPRPFHWAWGFFTLGGYPVYAIGRAVVTRRRTGRGIAVMWAAIAALVLGFIIAIAWAVWLMMSIFSTLQTQLSFS